MLDYLQTKYKQRLKFVRDCLIWFTLTRSIECIIIILYKVEMEWDDSLKRRYHSDGQDVIGHGVVLIINLVIEFILICYLTSFCNRIRREFRNAVDPELGRKRRQLRRIFTLYVIQSVYLAALLASSTLLPLFLRMDWSGTLEPISSFQMYAVTFILFIYVLLTVFPRNAITGFGKMPDQPTVATDQPIVMMGQPAVVTAQPTIVMDQSTFVPIQPTVVPGQSTFVMGQPTYVPDQPIVMPGQPFVIDAQNPK
jgi:hypothetical protein